MPGLPPPLPVYAAVSVTQFESLLARLGGRGHDVPETAHYVRHAPVQWRGMCTCCGAVAETLSRGPATKRSHKKMRPHARTEQKAAPRAYGRVDVRLLVPCRGPTGQEGAPPPGRPWR